MNQISENFVLAEEQFQQSQQGDFPRKVKFMERKFVLHKDVFSPEVLNHSLYKQ
jgi:hypothetical protein